MTQPLKIAGIERSQLAEYTATQLANLFPAPGPSFAAEIESYLPEVLTRLQVCIDAVQMWKPGVFDVFHSSQYCSYLYLLSRTAWLASQDRVLPTRLFGLNKALNGIDLFYEIDLPPHFFIGHSVGIVLAKAIYGDYLVLYQNSTVGKNNGHAPTLGRGCVLYPNTAVIGQCELGPFTTVSQGASLIDTSTPASCIVFRGSDRPIIKPVARGYAEDYFRMNPEW